MPDRKWSQVWASSKDRKVIQSLLIAPYFFENFPQGSKKKVVWISSPKTFSTQQKDDTWKRLPEVSTGDSRISSMAETWEIISRYADVLGDAMVLPDPQDVFFLTFF